MITLITEERKKEDKQKNRHISACRWQAEMWPTYTNTYICALIDGIWELIWKERNEKDKQKNRHISACRWQAEIWPTYTSTNIHEYEYMRRGDDDWWSCAGYWDLTWENMYDVDVLCSLLEEIGMWTSPTRPFLDI